MSLPLPKLVLAPALAVLLIGAYSCSSSQPSGESGNLDMASSDGSSADQVGSAPEDMLAGESEGEASSADPFADLAESNAEGGSEMPASEGDALLAVPSDMPEVEEHASSGGGEMASYTVKAGDTLMKVAFHLYGDVDRWKDLQDWNSSALKGGTALRKGMRLKYEAPAEPFELSQLEHSYEIKKGDTLAGIADEIYGRKMKYKKLQQYNARLIKNPNRIFAGFTIFYDITPKEMAEAEARRQQRMAEGGASPAAPADPAPSPAPTASAPPPPPPADPFANSVDSLLPPPPSALNPPPAPTAQPKSAATGPSASDSSAIPPPPPAQ